MNLAIAVESKQHPKNQNDYRVWYLEIDGCGQVVGVGAKSKQEMVENLFELEGLSKRCRKFNTSRDFRFLLNEHA